MNTKSKPYLTQIKELPPMEEGNKKKPSESDLRKNSFDLKSKDIDKTSEDLQNTTLEESKESFEEDFFDFKEEEVRKLPISAKEIILAVMNIFLIIFLIFIITKFPSKANELKKLRSESLINQRDFSPELQKIESYREKYDQIKKFFLDEQGVIDFINQTEKVAKVSFVSQKPVKDISGNFGIPVVLEFSGSWEDVGKILKDIDTLPFLFRVVKVEAKRKEETNMIVFKYGIVLYVNENLGKNR